jgi:aspartate/methionine/tyrosine aminotransferase
LEASVGRFPANDIITLVGAAPRYDLAESVGPDLRLRELLSGPELADLPLAYGTAEGDLRLRRAIAGLHGVAEDDVVITVGGMQGLFLLAFILCSGGGEAVIATPCFPPARDTLLAVGATLRQLPLAFERRYQPDLDRLRACLSPRTRLVSLASPQNPSGVAIAALAEIAAMMAAICPDAVLLVDETYREASYGDAAPTPSALALGPRIVSLASLSKSYGAPGLRLGWAITKDPALRRELVLGKFNTVVSCSPLDEALALRLLGQRGRVLGERRRILAEGLALTAAWVAEHRDLVEWVRPDAGALCCVRLAPAAFDDAAVERFHAELPAHEVRVGIGSWFGEERRVFRLGFGLLPPPELALGLRALGAALRGATALAAAS